MRSWRARLHLLHRDAGFLGLGLTVVYAVSGLAVNHRHHWNYNQSVETRAVRVGTPGELLAHLPPERAQAIAASTGAVTRDEQDELVRRVGAALGRATPPKNAFWRGPDKLSLFYETGERDTVDYHPSTGIAEHRLAHDRPVLRDMNWLHLNEGRRVWTWFADFYAVLLLFLGVSGILMVRGRGGLRGRGGVLLAVGVVVPLAVLVLMRHV